MSPNLRHRGSSRLRRYTIGTIFPADVFAPIEESNPATTSRGIPRHLESCGTVVLYDLYKYGRSLALTSGVISGMVLWYHLSASCFITANISVSV